MTEAVGAATALPARDASGRPSVCIVTGELVGPFKNGGIGTSMTGLAQCLASAGFAVTVLYSGANPLSETERRDWHRKFAASGIDLHWLWPSNLAAIEGLVADISFGTPYAVYRYLQNCRFDIIQFNDCVGDGYLCLSMKRMGAAFGQSQMLAALHSPSQWIFEVNRTLPPGLLPAAFNYAERLSVECADLLWSPSQYLLDWIRAAGFALPAATIVQQYAIPIRQSAGSAASEKPQPGGAAIRPDEIVFFGRLEERKGIRLFCAAMNRLSDLLTSQSIRVTFLGKFASVGDMSADEYLRGQSRNWNFEWQAITDLGQSEALDYLARGSTLAVMASPADNSPCTVYEALADGLCFIAARTGGIAELIDADDHESVLFDHDAGSLVAKIETVLRSGIAPARPSQHQSQCRARWADIFGSLSPARTSEPKRETQRRKLVALIDHWTGDDLEVSLAALQRCDQVHHIIILDHSGQLRNIAVGHRHIDLSQGSVPDLLAMIGGAGDDAVWMLRSGRLPVADNLPLALEALAFPEVDGIIAGAIGAQGKAIPPVGGSQSFCFFSGVDQGGGVIMKAERLPILQGDLMLATDSQYCNLADCCVAAGLKLWPFAEALLQHPDPARTDNGFQAYERIRAYRAIDRVERHYVNAIAIERQFAKPQIVERLYRRALRARAGGVIRRLRLATPQRIVNFVRKRLVG